MNGDKINQITLIEPKSGLVSINLAEMWSHRELLFFLTLRDIKVRYKQTAIGLFWVFLQPVLTTVILSVIFGQLQRFDSANVPYPLFVLSGIVLWLFVYTAITLTSNSFVNNTNLVTKVYFPRLIVPISSTLACVFDLLITLPFIALLMIYYRIGISWQLVIAPVFFILAFLLTSTLGTMFSALNVRFRDVKFALPFFLQVWMLASPIFYSANIIPEKWRFVFALNPLVGIIEGWRASLFATPIDWQIVGISVVSLIVILIISIVVFRRMEDDFADLI